jgi:hypothetical protein
MNPWSWHHTQLIPAQASALRPSSGEVNCTEIITLVTCYDFFFFFLFFWSLRPINYLFRPDGLIRLFHGRQLTVNSPSGMQGNQGDLFSVVIRLSAGRTGLIPCRGRDFFSSSSQPRQLWGLSNLLSKGYRALSLGAKRPGREDDHSRAVVKKAWSYTSIRPTSS